MPDQHAAAHIFKDKRMQWRTLSAEHRKRHLWPKSSDLWAALMIACLFVCVRAFFHPALLLAICRICTHTSPPHYELWVNIAAYSHFLFVLRRLQGRRVLIYENRRPIADAHLPNTRNAPKLSNESRPTSHHVASCLPKCHTTKNTNHHTGKWKWWTWWHWEDDVGEWLRCLRNGVVVDFGSRTRLKKLAYMSGTKRFQQ